VLPFGFKTRATAICLKLSRAELLPENRHGIATTISHIAGEGLTVDEMITKPSHRSYPTDGPDFTGFSEPHAGW